MKEKFNIWGLLLLVRVVSGQMYTCEQPAVNHYSVIVLQKCSTFYQAVMELGTPPQALPFLIDTGSLSSWIPAMSCNCGSGININASYTATVSSKQQNITYQDGDSIFGYEGTEIASFRNTTFIVVKIPIVFVVRKQAPLMGDRGLIGLGYSEDNIFDIAYKQGVIQTSTFILKLSRQFNQSRLYFNTLPQQIVQNSVYSPIQRNMHLWAIKSFGVEVNGEDLTTHARGAVIIDSGTTVTTLNYGLYRQVVRIFFNNCQSNQTIHTITCPLTVTAPTFKFYLQGNIVYLDPKFYTSQNSTHKQIFLSVSEYIVLGQSFFQKYIITFDKTKNQIGFFGDHESMSRLGDNFFYGSSIASTSVLGLTTSLVLVSLISGLINLRSNSNNNMQYPPIRY